FFTPPQATRPVVAPVVAVESRAEIAPAATLVSNPAPAVTPAPAAVTPAPVAMPVAAPVAAPAAPVEGRTELGEGVYAMRAGDTVTVHFDTPLTRTRYAEKFERIVRSTLPRVMGETSAAASALATVPVGQLAVAGDLLTELPARGIELPLDAGRTLTLWPETRPGMDGPLVVRYRAVIK
ncbi:MAG TPA: hypothetical protein VKA84_09015, partial [Gemmatimonadaceae bacterium]|nr:hypothetical protein [Gemmatimonadaceae bacterium]